MKELVVTDASCLIALSRVGLLDMLPRLFRMYAPPAVVDEFGTRPAWLHVEAVGASPLLDVLLTELDRGEAEAIALAKVLGDVRVLLDERDGRRVARRLGLPMAGTAGILLAAKKASMLSTIQPVLDALRDKHDFRLSDALYEAVVRAAGEL